MGVYEILAVSSPILGLSAFGCAQIVMVLLLRRRFLRHDQGSSLQRQLQFALYGGFALCAVVWIVVFVICSRAVLRETIAGSMLPLPLFAFVLACAFAGLIAVSWFSMRHFAKDLEALAAEFEELGQKRGGVTLPSSRSAVSRSDISELRKKSRQVVLYLGASSYRDVLEQFTQVDTGAR